MNPEDLLRACRERRVITTASEKHWRRLLEKYPEPASRILEVYRSFPMPFQTAKHLAGMSPVGDGKLNSNSPYTESMDAIDWGTGTGRIFPYLRKDFMTLQEQEPSTIKEIIKTLPVAVAMNLTYLQPDPQRELRKSFRKLDGFSESSNNENSSPDLESVEQPKPRQSLLGKLVGHLLGTGTSRKDSGAGATRGQDTERDVSASQASTDANIGASAPIENGSTASSVRFPRPKFFFLNVGGGAAERLRTTGYAVFDGDIGTPYRVPPGDGFYPVPITEKMPPSIEQDVVIIDLAPPKVIKNLPAMASVQEGIDCWWAQGKQGLIDPRPGLLASLSEDFERIWRNGGAFIIFAAPQLTDRFARGQMVGGRPRIKETLFVYEWSFLPKLFGYVQPVSNIGHEIQPNAETTGWLQELTQVLQRFIADSVFTCTLSVADRAEERWVTLASSKFGSPVAGALAPEGDEGWIFIFPQIKDKAGFLLEILDGLLPSVMPSLFPYYDSLKWSHEPAYLFHDVRQHREEIDRTRSTAEESISTHQQKIASLQAERQHVYQILTLTGTPLVQAVMKVLRDFGFQTIIDPDSEIMASKETSRGQFREDLQVLDRSPALLVEIKGINDLPSEAEALQVTKYVPRRRKDWNRPDVRGLFIVNHQRRRPPNQREHKNVFQEDLLLNAESNGFGVITTFDLFCFYRNWLRYRWQPEFIQTIFYQFGRIVPIPAHYDLIGEIEHIWPKVNVIGIRLKSGALALQNKISFEVGMDLEECIVESLQVDKHDVRQADIGQLAGVRTPLALTRLSKGCRVFRVGALS